MRVRPLCIAIIFYIIGIIMGLYLKTSMVLLSCVLALFIINILFKKTIYILFIFMIILGFFAIKIIDHDYMQQYKILNEKNTYKIQATIISDKIEKSYTDMYQVEINLINGKQQDKKRRWILNVKKQNINSEIKYGDIIDFEGKIEFPQKSRNYMGFDYQQYLKTEKIYGTISNYSKIKIIDTNKTFILNKIWHNIRTDIQIKLHEVLPRELASICICMLIGDKNGLTEDVRNDFQKSSLTHLLAISGAHVEYVCLGISLILKKFNYKFSKTSMILLLYFFMGLTGFTPSVERACIMTITILLGKMLYRRVEIYTSLATSAFIILFVNPYSILDLGFVLSYAGTIGIIMFYKKILLILKNKPFLTKEKSKDSNDTCFTRFLRNNIIYKIKEYIIGTLMISVSANMVIIPIIAYKFNIISFTFWISNVLASLTLGIVVILGFIVYLISIFSMQMSSILALPLKIILQLLILITKLCSEIPFSNIIIRTPYFYEIALYYFVLFIIYKFTYLKKYFLKLINILLIITISFYSCIYIKNTEGLKIYFIDVGQGESTLICTPTNKKILIDGGGNELGSFDVGEKILLPYLLDRKITKIDYIMISHFDTDHVRLYMYYIKKVTSKKNNNIKTR